MLGQEKKWFIEPQAQLQWARVGGARWTMDTIDVHTVNTYCQQACHFVRYCREHHQCTGLAQCRPHADEWLASRSHLSRYTLILDATVLARLYGEPNTHFIRPGKPRHAPRSRSREKRSRDRFFSEERNQDFVAFCRGTGLTRSELNALTGDQLRKRGGNAYIRMPARRGEGIRKVPVIGDVERIVKMMRVAGKNKVFSRIFVAADIQGYRLEYARALYQMHARDYETCLKTPFKGDRHSSGKRYASSVYRLRGARQGEWLDRQAMQLVTDALGLRHFKSFAENYLR